MIDAAVPLPRPDDRHRKAVVGPGQRLRERRLPGQVPRPGFGGGWGIVKGHKGPVPGKPAAAQVVRRAVSQCPLIPPEAGADNHIVVEGGRGLQQGLGDEQAGQRLPHQGRPRPGPEMRGDEGANLLHQKPAIGGGPAGGGHKRPVRRHRRRRGQIVAPVHALDPDDDHLLPGTIGGIDLGDAGDVVKVLREAAVQEMMTEREESYKKKMMEREHQARLDSRGYEEKSKAVVASFLKIKF